MLYVPLTLVNPEASLSVAFCPCLARNCAIAVTSYCDLGALMLKLTLLADRATVTVLLTHIFADARPMRASNAKYIVPAKTWCRVQQLGPVGFDAGRERKVCERRERK